jgi:thiol-disulfide isomerase/thioredoxin
MTSRLLATFGLATLMVGLASAQDKPASKDNPSIKAQAKEAMEAFENEPAKAIAILEKALQIAPEDREALFLLGSMTTIQGEQVEDKAERIALFHKSSATFAKLTKRYKELKPSEKKNNGRSQINEARALALEGKSEESLQAIKTAMASGLDVLDILESEKDFDTVRELPELKAIVEAVYKPMLAEAMKEVAKEMARTKSFPFAFELKDTDDKTVTLADYKGKVTIVDVWGTWCPPCRKEIPHFVNLYKEFKPKGLEIVGINCNEKGSRDQVKKTIKSFVKENKMEYRCVLDDENTADKIPGFEGFPTTLFLDRTGKVKMMLVGYTPKAKLEAIITTLLAENAKPTEAKSEEKPD